MLSVAKSLISHRTEHASTTFPWNGAASGEMCACLPGFKSVRSAGVLVRCQACASTEYSTYGMADDTACLPCPSG